ncbi:MAG: glycosyltransferase family 2 protein [Lachnospiraceae bacterium]|nr:glycosyltransferase family 2 protein [Lachnospiraceae bacterium]
MNVSFVVPCYNEEGNVAKMYYALHEAFRDLESPIECVMVDDGSRDGTLPALRALVSEARDPGLKVVSFSRNFGKEAAILAGLRHAEGDLVCVIDADLQQDPAVAREMYEILMSRPEVDAVGAYQDKRKESVLLRFFKKCFYSLVNRLCETSFRPAASDFRMMRRKMVDAVLSMTEYHRFSKGLFSWVGFQTEYIPYTVRERNSGRSSWSFGKLFLYAMEGIIGSSTKPLRIPYYIGGFLSIASLVLIIVEIVLSALGRKLPEHALVLSVMILLFGCLFFVLGIMGSYLARTYVQSKDRPVYIEKELLQIREETSLEHTSEMTDNHG